MKNRNLLLLCLSGIALSACASFSNKPVNDCSTIFEDPQKVYSKQASSEFSADEGNEQAAPGQCKVLKIKIKEDVSCEISGSESTDKLLELYQTDEDPDRVVLISPIKGLNAKEIASNYKTVLTYYKLLNNIQDHVDSDVFEGIKDYKYKGIKCESSTQKFVGWIGKDNLVASYKDKAPDSNVTQGKAVKQKAVKRTNVKSKVTSNKVTKTQ